MKAISRADAPVAIEGDGVELRMQRLGGGMTTAFARVPQGADFTPALAGLPGDLCQCPHWEYLLEGRVKMHTRDGEEVYEAGQAFYWAAGMRSRRSRTRSMSMPCRQMLVVPRLACPSWRWMTLSGTPSRASSTAWAWRS